jgi:antitoxin ParD1/3/4
MTEKLSITVPSEMARLIRERVDRGDYASTSEFMRDAVRAWSQREEDRVQRLAAIRARIERSISDPRPSLSIDDVWTELAELHERTLNSK